jgi:ubiquinone/menaquinone biosynthesis C-methylase UbiE
MFINPEKCVARLGLKEGMKVVDLGAGFGIYSKLSSSRVGHTGKVFAVEVQKEFVKKLEADVKEWNIKNIDCIWGDIEKKHGTKIADGFADAVIVSNVFFQVEDKLGLIDEARRIMKHGGNLLFIDWNSTSPLAPNASKSFNSKKVRELFESRGFKFIEDVVAGVHHYGIIFKHD